MRSLLTCVAVNCATDQSSMAVILSGGLSSPACELRHFLRLSFLRSSSPAAAGNSFAFHFIVIAVLLQNLAATFTTFALTIIASPTPFFYNLGAMFTLVGMFHYIDTLTFFYALGAMFTHIATFHYIAILWVAANYIWIH